jgi:hypothetical protein
MNPCLICHITGRPINIILAHLHSSPISIVLYRFQLRLKPSLILHGVEAPIGADVDDVRLLLFAVLIPVNPGTSPVGIQTSDAGSRQLISRQGQQPMLRRSKLLVLEGGVRLPIVA